MDERQPHVEAGHPLACLHDHFDDLIGEERRLRKPHHLVHGEPRISQDREQHSRVVVLEKKGTLGSVRLHREEDESILDVHDRGATLAKEDLSKIFALDNPGRERAWGASRRCAASNSP